MLESPSLLRPEQRRTQVQQLLEGETPAAASQRGTARCRSGSEKGEAHQLAVIRRGRNRVDHRPTGRITPEHRVRRAERLHRRPGPAGPVRGEHPRPGPPAVQPHAQWQDQAKLRRVLAIRLKVFTLEKAAPEVCNGSGRQQQVNGLCPDLDPARQIERISSMLLKSTAAAARSGVLRERTPERDAASRHHRYAACPAGGVPRRSSDRGSCADRS